MNKLRVLSVPMLIFLFVLGGVLAVALSTEGSAVNGMLPCAFYGEVTIDGANVPDGTQIKGTIDGVVDEWTTTTITDGGKSVYVLDIPSDTGPPKNGGVEGDTVHFFVGPTEIQGPDSTWTEVTGYLVLHHLHVSTAPPEYTLTMTVVGNGTVAPGTGVYAEGDMTITATPESGWQFDGWSTDDMSEIDDPAALSTTLNLDKDKTVTATFSLIGEGQMLYAGWNLVTFNGETQPVEDAVSSLVDEGALVIIWYFHNDTKDWDMYSPTVAAHVNDLETVEALMPYWINVDRDILWTY